MMWEVLRSKLLFQVMTVVKIVMVMAVIMRAGNVAAAARLVGEAAQQKGKDAALELTTEVFNSSLWATPATSVIVEFYAHWCPACQSFKPHYERLAQLFNGQDAAYPGVLLMAKVDCAEEDLVTMLDMTNYPSSIRRTDKAQINKNLCHRFSVKRYPTMLWGKPATFARGSRLQEKDERFELIESRMHAQSLLDWINTRLKTSYSLDPAIEKKQSGHVTDFEKTLVSIHDIEEATAEAYHIILSDKLVGSSQRAPFVQFLQLLAAHHPSRRCRAGSAQILFNLMDAWPSEHVDERVPEGGSQTDSNLADVVSLRQLHICGEDLPSKTYKTCKMVTGGYSCGLWYLFHALSVRVDDSESNGAMRAICNFVANFFTCEECRQHFLTMSQRAIDSVSSRRDLTLWLWRAHNEVNHRLGKDAEVSGELRTSKVQWPTKAICAACRSSETTHGNADEKIEWYEDEVYKFLRKTYGQSILTVVDEEQSLGSKGRGAGYGKDENLTSSAITAPVGAAVGIAMASCGFGVAACCWRLQQKKRKYCSCTPWAL